MMRRCHLGNLCHLQGAHFHPSTLPLLLNMTEVLGVLILYCMPSVLMSYLLMHGFCELYRLSTV